MASLATRIGPSIWDGFACLACLSRPALLIWVELKSIRTALTITARKTDPRGVGPARKVAPQGRRSMAISVQVDLQTQRSSSRAQAMCPAQLRALALWPRLDRRALARCGCDPARIANYVSRRTRMPTKSIETLLAQA